MKRSLERRAVMIAAAAIALATTGAAQPQLPTAEPRRLESPKPLSLPQTPPAVHRQTVGTAFFVDGAGHMLTARHAVEDCRRVVVAKETWRVEAQVVAVSARWDLALLKIGRTLGLSAVFPRDAVAGPDDWVFAGGYDTLEELRTRGVLANARVVRSFGGSEAGHLVIDSAVTFGASGAPVLDERGLVQGVVSRRTLINRVLAVDAVEAKAFLTANGVRGDVDDRPQIAAGGSRAHRAASLSARVTYLQN